MVVQFVIEKKSMTVSDNTVQAGGLGDFFKNLGGKGLNVVIRNPKIVTTTLPELINFNHTCRVLYLGKFV